MSKESISIEELLVDEEFINWVGVELKTAEGNVIKCGIEIVKTLGENSSEHIVRILQVAIIGLDRNVNLKEIIEGVVNGEIEMDE